MTRTLHNYLIRASAPKPRILDVGCGTGNMAQALKQMGYNNLEGLDPSPGMLEIAKKKGIFQCLHPMYLSERIDLADESYDAVVAAGVLTHGHAPPESLDGILRLCKPGAIMVFSLSRIAYEDQGFSQKMEMLNDSGEWQLLDRSRLFRSYPFSEKEAHLRHWVFAFRKTGR